MMLQHDGSWAMADCRRGKHTLIRDLLRIIAAGSKTSRTVNSAALQVPAGSQPSAEAAAAAAGGATAVSVGAVGAVSHQELVGASRVLLLLLLQLFSSAEAAGVYGASRSGHHSQRGLAVRANDRSPPWHSLHARHH